MTTFDRYTESASRITLAGGIVRQDSLINVNLSSSHCNDQKKFMFQVKNVDELNTIGLKGS